MSKTPHNYSFRVFDGPPVGRQYPPWNQIDPFRLESEAPTFLGKLEGVLHWVIEKELNNMEATAEITLPSAQSRQSVVATDIVLASNSQKVTTNGSEIVDSVTYSIIDGSIPFKDSKIDVNTFIQISRIPPPAGGDEIIIFHGKVVAFDINRATGRTTIRLQSLGLLAAQYPAVFCFGFYGQAQTELVGPDNQAVGPLPNLIFSASDNEYGNEWHPFEIMNWLIARNPYINGEIGLADTESTRVEIEVGIKTVGEIVTECLESLGPDWAYRINFNESPASSYGQDTHLYDPTDTTNIGVGQIDLGKRYRPEFRMLHLPTYVKSSTFTITPEMIGEGDGGGAISFSGEESFERVVYLSTSQNPTYVTKVNDPHNHLFPELAVKQPTYSTQTDENGNETEVLDRGSVFIPRIVGDSWFGPSDKDSTPDNERGLSNTDTVTKNKNNNNVTNHAPRTKLVENTRVLPITGENRKVLANYLLLEAKNDLAKNNSPSYSARVVVINSDRKAVDSWEVGQPVAFRGFGDLLDNVRGVVAALRHTEGRVELTINKVLPTNLSRLQSLERQIIQLSRADSRL